MLRSSGILESDMVQFAWTSASTKPSKVQVRDPACLFPMHYCSSESELTMQVPERNKTSYPELLRALTDNNDTVPK